MYCHVMDETRPVILVRDWRSTEEALQKARAGGTSPVLITPRVQHPSTARVISERCRPVPKRNSPTSAFELIVDCGDAPGHALACLRAGVKRISMSGPNRQDRRHRPADGAPNW